MSHKTFFKITFTIIVSISLLHLGFFEWYARKYIAPNDTVLIKEKELLARKNQIKIISLGDSHMEGGLKMPNERFFNFSRHSDSIPVEYFKLKFLLKMLPGLKTIILEADYHQFSFYTTKDNFRRYSKYIDEEVDIELGIYPKRFAYAFYFLSLEESYSPIVHKDFVSRFLPVDMTSTAEASAPDMRRWSEVDHQTRKDIARERTKVQIYNKYLVNTNLVAYYEKIIKLCNENNISVFLLRLPLSNEYLEQVSDNVEFQISQIYKRLQSDHKFRILDYRKIFRSRQELFRDSDHLNKYGSKELGKNIMADIVKKNNANL